MFYLFHHIPRTAGKSCLEAFGQMFRVVMDYHDPLNLDAYPGTEVDLSSLTENDILCGHYNMPGMMLYDRYPNLDDFEHRRITFLREPLATAASGVRFGAKRGWMDDPDRMLLRRTNYFSRTLGCTADNYRDVLDAFWFVGVSEDLEEGIAEIARRLGKPVPDVPWINTTNQIDVEVSQDAACQFIERAGLDSLIYDYATRQRELAKSRSET